jgi:hypothetical protein
MSNFIPVCDLPFARGPEDARPCPGIDGCRKGKCKGKAKQPKATNGKGAKRATNEDTPHLDDSEVKRHVEQPMRLDEEEEKGRLPEAALVRDKEPFGVDE